MGLEPELAMSKIIVFCKMHLKFKAKSECSVSHAYGAYGTKPVWEQKSTHVGSNFLVLTHLRQEWTQTLDSSGSKPSICSSMIYVKKTQISS